MLQINETGKIQKWNQGKGLEKITLDEITEKEILVTIAAKLHSIRGMLIFFTILSILSLIGGIIAIINILSSLKSSYNSF